jgi:ribosomal protein S18 acetylase RimI-like enzyme
MAGYDGHRGWLYAAAVLQSHQRQGIGTALVRAAENLLSAMGCTKINLQVRASNTAVTRFYNSLGYEIEERVSMGKRLHQQIERVRLAIRCSGRPAGVDKHAGLDKD